MAEKNSNELKVLKGKLSQQKRKDTRGNKRIKQRLESKKSNRFFICEKEVTKQNSMKEAFMEKEKKQMVSEIGRTCYTVNLIFKESGRETYKDKVFRLLKQEIENEQEKKFEEIQIMTFTNLPKYISHIVQKVSTYTYMPQD